MVALGVASADVVIETLNRPFDHDEHQFIMPSYHLLDGVLPYRDYLYFHLPLQVFAYTPLVAAFDDGLLATRLFNAAAAIGLLTLLLLWGRREIGASAGLTIAAALVLVLGSATVTSYTVSRAWNHTGGVLAALGAFVLVLRAAERDTAWRWVLAGLLLGVAIGWRLTLLPLLAPFGLGVLFLGDASRRTPRMLLKRVTWFGVGAITPLLPVIALALTSPERFYVGNFVYPSFSNAFHRSNNEIWDWGRKVSELIKDIRSSPKHVLIVAGLVFSLALAAITAARRGRQHGRPLVFGLLVFAFVLFGSYMPGRLHIQYNFAPAVFASVVIVLALSFCIRHGMKAKPLTMAGTVLSLVALAATLYGLRHPPAPAQWEHRRVMEIVDVIRPYVEGREVVTLAPLFVELAGGQTSPHFATGPFPWRTSPHVPEALRERLEWAGLERYAAPWRVSPPEVFFTGSEGPDVEAPLVDFIEELGYQPVRFAPTQVFRDREPVVWLRPDDPRLGQASGSAVP